MKTYLEINGMNLKDALPELLRRILALEERRRRLLATDKLISGGK